MIITRQSITNRYIFRKKIHCIFYDAERYASGGNGSAPFVPSSGFTSNLENLSSMIIHNVFFLFKGEKIYSRTWYKNIC